MKYPSLHEPDGTEKQPLINEEFSFYQFAESNPSPILVTNTETEIQYVNAAWEQLTGYTNDEVRGKNPRFLSSGKTPPELYQNLTEALRRGDSFESENFINTRKDGTEFILRAIFFPIFRNGVTTHYVQIIRDISKEKEIDKQKDLFISSASHELRSPLSTITFSLDLLKQELGTVSQGAADILKTLDGEIKRFISLLDYLLDINRIYSGTLRIDKREHNLRELVRKVAEELQPTFTTHTFVLEGSAEPVVLSYDQARIAQVLINLITNAVKYSPQADKIIIRLERQPEAAVFSVQDFGTGIDPDEQQKIFTLLYRARNKGSVPGMGLGLYIAAQIVAAHSGRLWLASEPGNGSTFYFSLPVEEKMLPSG